jgi:WD40 repeat protein
MSRVTSALLLAFATLLGGVCCERAPTLASAQGGGEGPAPEALADPLTPASEPARALALAEDPDALPPGATVRLGTRALAHGERLRAVAWAGDHLVTASESQLRVWDAGRGWELARLDTPVGLVALSPDGLTLATSPTEAREVRLWRVGDGSPARVVQTGPRQATALAFAPDGATLAAASSVGEVRLFSVEDGRTVAELEVGRRWPGSLAFSRAGDRLAVGSRDGVILVFEVPGGGPPLVVRGAAEHVVALAFSAQGEVLAAGALGSPGVTLYDAATGDARAVLQAHQGGVTSLVFGPSDEVLVSAALDRTVRRWSVETRSELGAPTTGWGGEGLAWFAPGVGAHVGGEWPRLALSPDGVEVAAVGYGEAVVRVGLADGEVLARSGPGAAITALAFSSDGQRVLAGSEDGSVSIWRAATGEREQVLRGYREPIVGLALEGDTLRSRSGWTERLWELGSGRQVSATGRRFAALGALAFDAAGALVLADYGRVLVVDPRTGVEERVLETDPRSFPSVASGAPGGTLVLGRSGRGDALFDVSSGRRLRGLEALRDHRSAVLSAGGATLAAVGRDGRVTIWRLEEEEEVAAVATYTPRRRAEHVALSPDGRWVAAGGRGDLTVWEVAGGAVRQPGFSGHVRSLAWSADGSHVAAAGTHEVMSYGLGAGVTSVRVSQEADAVALSSEGGRVAALLPDGRVRLWRSGSSEPLLELDTQPPAGQGMASASPALAFSADARLLAAVGRFNQVTVFDLETRERLLVLGDGTVPRGAATGRATSADGRVEARVVAGWEIEVVEVGTSSPVVRARLAGHGAPVTALAFSSDGGMLATGSSDTTVLLWPLGVE